MSIFSPNVNFIVLFGGPHASGDGYASRLLIKHIPSIGLMRSVALWNLRQGECPPKYHGVTDDQFRTLHDEGKFLLTLDLYERKYGTLKTDVESIIGAPYPSIVRMHPSKVDEFDECVREMKGGLPGVLKIHFACRDQDLVRERLRKRYKKATPMDLDRMLREFFEGQDQCCDIQPHRVIDGRFDLQNHELFRALMDPLTQPIPKVSAS